MEITPKTASESLLSVLPKRSAIVLEKRFGLGKTGKRFTLDAIGKTYGITRERIRQIERDALQRIQKSSTYAGLETLFADFKNSIAEKGGAAAEADLIAHFDADDNSANAVRFLLTLAPNLFYRGETDEYHARWGEDVQIMDTVEDALQSTARIVSARTAMPYDELQNIFQKEYTVRFAGTTPNYSLLQKFLSLSKEMGENCFGQWGHTSSPLIRPRGVRDLAYLVFQKEHTPMHFSTAAERIGAVVAPRRVHAQTVHNELIKDNRFVLVGRGTYALVEWGYESGTVRDIITRVLTDGPKSREAIIQLALAKRHVKENTIMINLQNRKYFKKLHDDTYGNIA